MKSLIQQIPAKDRKRIRERLKNEPRFRYESIRMSLVMTAIRQRRDFNTEQAYQQCFRYLVDVILPRYFFAGKPWNDEALRGLAEIAIAAFVAGEQLTAIA